MNKKTKIILLLSIIFILIISVYMYSLNAVFVQDINFNKLEKIDMGGFTLKGNLILKNNGFFPIDITKMTYYIFLEKTNALLANGFVVGKEIPAHHSETLEFTKFVKWSPSVEFAKELILNNETNIRIEGIITIKIIMFSFDINFDKKLNIQPVIKQYLEKESGVIISKVVEGIDVVSKVLNKLST